ncbi:hypothetical protein BJV78DRAFT_1397670 [Lactifluus subvellereus]|nr:hypothetical protein BJV78DRAFT_1397670 [Lactifluus subvellereus]
MKLLPGRVTMEGAPPPSKRAKLEPVSPKDESEELVLEPETEVDEDHCTICLQPIVDRTLVPTCSHEFCFECLMLWSAQSRRCPLCAQDIGDYLIHRIRSTFDYQKHFIPPLRTSPPPLAHTGGARPALVHRRRERVWGPRDHAARDEADALERAVSRRRWIYQHNLYAKHVASNKYTRYRPYPTPTQFAASQDLISRTTVFLRRELLVWPNADVEFLVTFVISLMKSIDIRSESAVKLLAEFLDMDTPYVPGERHVNAEHFAHEIYCYLRSPYRDLNVYDSVVQYDTPPGIPPPLRCERTRRWGPGPSQAQSQSPNLRRSHSNSHAPSKREWNVRRERSAGPRSLQRGPDTRKSNSPHSPAEDLRADRSVSSSAYDEDDSHETSDHSRPPTNTKAKGKRRAQSYSPSPSRESDTWSRNSPVVHHGRAGSLAASSTTPTSPSRSRSPINDTSESRSERSPVQPRDKGPSAASATHAIDRAPIPFEGPHSLSSTVASSSSTSEAPESLAIDDRPHRATLTRQPRYRNQRDTIVAYLLAPSSTTPRPPPSIQSKRIPSLLARMTTDETVAPSGPEGDANVTEGKGGEGDADLAPSRPEQSPDPSANDDPSRGEETAPTKVESSESGKAPQRSSRACLLDRLNVEMTTAVEARLRTQARLRARLAVERRLAQDDK